MRKLLMVAVCILVAGSVSAQPTGYMGLYTDAARSTSCAYGVGFYPVEMWIWNLPSGNGAICSEFMISYPVNVIRSTVTWNTGLISVSLGEPGSGLSVCYVACQYDWHWNLHQSLWVTDPTRTEVLIVAHPGVGVYQFANCLPGYPVETPKILTKLLINASGDDCTPFATTPSSWGAIKSLID